MIGKELVSPYLRPPLTKGLWKGKPLDKIWRGTEKFNVDLRLGREARSIDPVNHTVVDDRGEIYHYEKLLIATGGTPSRLPFGGDHILYYRTLDDYLALRELANQGGTFAVIGGGYIGSEITAALSMNHLKTVMVFPEDGIGARVFPRELSQFITDYYRQKGVEVLTGIEVSGLDRGENQFILQLKDRVDIQADAVIAGLGIQPNTDLAQAAGIEIDNGIVVNDYLETNQPDIYSAGDVAAFFNPALEQRLRVEHEDNANTMGETAGKNMAGERVPYHHLPFFIPICLSWVTKPSASSIQDWRHLQIGANRTKRVSSITFGKAEFAGSCCGTCGGKWMLPVR